LINKILQINQKKLINKKLNTDILEIIGTIQL